MQNEGALKRTYEMMDWTPDESPFAVQLFGNNPEHMARAAKVVVAHGANMVDINMGCWVPKVAKKGGGAALLKDVDTAKIVVEAVVNAVDVPVTVKIRSGFDDGDLTAVAFARAAESVGVAAITVHARYASQGFGGCADWNVIRWVKEAVTIPIIGNGDIFSAADAAQMFSETGCDAIMIGRASLGTPWIFHHVETALRTGVELPEPGKSERAALALRLAELTIATSPLEERHAVRELRGQISKYQLDEPNEKYIRNQLVRVESLTDIKRILTPLL
jgi:nifR3 family TIM-barrel protein